MVRIGKFFKNKHHKKEDDEGSVLTKTSKGEASPSAAPDVPSPVDEADTPADELVDLDDEVPEAVSAEKSEQRDEPAPFDLARSASESDHSGTYQDSVFESQGINPMMENDEQQLQSLHTDKSFVTTAMENDVTAKYFHKDVVVNSLEEGANGLVIRAMYFIPKPNVEDHVVVKVEASTISPRDVMNCNGHGLTKAMLPYVPGYEIVGTIQHLGEDVKSDGGFRRGDRVAGISLFGGGNSRFISIDASRLTKISNNIKSTNAVCLLHDYIAALKTLRLARKNGSPFTGLNILITNGFSPVGQAIITLAGMEGANVYACADESKHPYLATLGVKCFETNPEVWLPSAAHTFDIVIDNTCINGYNSSWHALNKKGTLICLGPIYNIDMDIEAPPSACGIVELTEMQQKWSAIKAKYMMSQTYFLNTATTFDDDTEQYKQDLKYLMFLCERGDIKPKIAERVSLDDVPDAQRLMQLGKANGTVVCVPWIEE